MTWRRILLLWLLLALSVQLMIGEILLVQAAVSRQPDEKIMLAALGVSSGWRVLIEVPLVMLLSTSTAGWAGTDQYGSIRL